MKRRVLTEQGVFFDQEDKIREIKIKVVDLGDSYEVKGIESLVLKKSMTFCKGDYIHILSNKWKIFLWSKGGLPRLTRYKLKPKCPNRLEFVNWDLKKVLYKGRTGDKILSWEPDASFRRWSWVLVGYDTEVSTHMYIESNRGIEYLPIDVCSSYKRIELGFFDAYNSSDNTLFRDEIEKAKLKLTKRNSGPDRGCYFKEPRTTFQNQDSKLERSIRDEVKLLGVNSKGSVEQANHRLAREGRIMTEQGIAFDSDGKIQGVKVTVVDLGPAYKIERSKSRVFPKEDFILKDDRMHHLKKGWSIFLWTRGDLPSVNLYKLVDKGQSKSVIIRPDIESILISAKKGDEILSWEPDTTFTRWSWVLIGLTTGGQSYAVMKGLSHLGSLPIEVVPEYKPVVLRLFDAYTSKNHASFKVGLEREIKYLKAKEIIHGSHDYKDRVEEVARAGVLDSNIISGEFMGVKSLNSVNSFPSKLFEPKPKSITIEHEYHNEMTNGIDDELRSYLFSLSSKSLKGLLADFRVDNSVSDYDYVVQNYPLWKTNELYLGGVDFWKLVKYLPKFLNPDQRLTLISKAKSVNGLRGRNLNDECSKQIIWLSDVDERRAKLSSHEDACEKNSSAEVSDDSPSKGTANKEIAHFNVSKSRARGAILSVHIEGVINLFQELSGRDLNESVSYNSLESEILKSECSTSASKQNKDRDDFVKKMEGFEKAIMAEYLKLTGPKLASVKNVYSRRFGDLAGERLEEEFDGRGGGKTQISGLTMKRLLAISTTYIDSDFRHQLIKKVVNEYKSDEFDDAYLESMDLNSWKASIVEPVSKRIEEIEAFVIPEKCLNIIFWLCGEDLKAIQSTMDWLAKEECKVLAKKRNDINTAWSRYSSMIGLAKLTNGKVHIESKIQLGCCNINIVISGSSPRYMLIFFTVIFLPILVVIYMKWLLQW